MTVWTIIAVLAALGALAGAAGSWLCLWTLWTGQERDREPDREPEDGGDEELREGILNLLRYAPAGKQEEGEE